MQIPQTRPRIRLTDGDILALVQQHGIALTQQQLSRLCGRNASWFSCLKARHERMSVEGITTLAMNVMRLADIHPDWQRQIPLMELHTSLMIEVIRRAAENAQTPRRRSNQGLSHAHT